MRGIAELLEVSPATPTAADAPIVQNGKDQVDLATELTKALPPSDHKMPSPEAADILPPPPPPPAPSSYTQPEENGLLKDSVSVESIEAPPPKAKPKPASRSPSRSPQMQRRVVQQPPPPPSSQGGGGAPPPPRRAPQTALSSAPDSLAAQNRYSYSSSTSSLSSSYSERVAGSVDVPLATHTQQQVGGAVGRVSESPPRIPPKKKPSPSRRTMAPGEFEKIHCCGGSFWVRGRQKGLSGGHQTLVEILLELRERELYLILVIVTPLQRKYHCKMSLPLEHHCLPKRRPIRLKTSQLLSMKSLSRTNTSETTVLVVKTRTFYHPLSSTGRRWACLWAGLQIRVLGRLRMRV